MKALLEYAKACELSQAALARRLGVSQGQLNYWMRGKRYPSAENLKRISEKTGMSLEKLLRDV